MRVRFLNSSVHSASRDGRRGTARLSATHRYRPRPGSPTGQLVRTPGSWGACVRIGFGPFNTCCLYRVISGHVADTIFTVSSFSIGAVAPVVAEAGLTVPEISTW